jgi:hypothetical protein
MAEQRPHLPVHRSIAEQRFFESGQCLPVSFLSLVALAGSLVLRTYFRKSRADVEPLSRVRSLNCWAGEICCSSYWRADMPKAVRISRAINVFSTKSDTHEFVSVALFSGIGLLISLVAVIAGVRAFWF